MSKYRVLDDSKNKYDADIIAPYDPTPNGFTIEMTSNVINSNYNCSGNVTVVIDSIYPNPLGSQFPLNGGYIGTIVEIPSANEGHTVYYSYSIIFINNSKFDIRISNCKVLNDDDTYTFETMFIPAYSRAETPLCSGTASVGFFNTANFYLESFVLART